MTTVIAHAVTVFVRQWLPSWRSPVGLLFGMLQPLLFLMFFGPLLGGVDGLPAVAAGGAADSWAWFVPGVLVMLALFGTTGTGYGLLTEMQTGSHERLLVTPLNRTAMLAGRTLNDVVTLLAQALLVVLAMLPFGLRPHPLGLVLALLLLATLGLGVGALSHALAIACRAHEESFYAIQSSILFPLLFLSGLMLPLEMGPGWMQTVGRWNPLTAIVEALRAVFVGRFEAGVVTAGAASAAALAVVGLALGTRAMRRAGG